jgi:methyl-accepting chemotaxis protein
MNTITPLRPARAGLGTGQAESSYNEISELSTLLRQMVQAPTSEIDSLIDAFQLLREKLQTAANRIQRDIEEYSALSQQVMQLTTIISESVKKLPSGVGR